MTTTPPPKPRRRRFLQFSLRSLLLFVLLVSVGLSWLGVKLERARRQREAVEAIEGAGGGFIYDYLSRDIYLPHDIPSEPPVPKWARAILGDDFFFDVVAIWSSDEDFGDAEVMYLRALTNVEVLDLADARITDVGLHHIKALSKLESLRLSRTQVTDVGLGNLKQLTDLRSLQLDGTLVTDDGLKYLEGLTSLEYLDLRDTQVTPEGVKKLQKALPKCKIVYHE